jgi:hypothetical protein
MATERSRAAAFDRTHDLELVEGSQGRRWSDARSRVSGSFISSKRTQAGHQATPRLVDDIRMDAIRMPTALTADMP